MTNEEKKKSAREYYYRNRERILAERKQKYEADEE